MLHRKKVQCSSKHVITESLSSYICNVPSTRTLCGCHNNRGLRYMSGPRACGVSGKRYPSTTECIYIYIFSACSIRRTCFTVPLPYCIAAGPYKAKHAKQSTLSRHRNSGQSSRQAVARQHSVAQGSMGHRAGRGRASRAAQGGTGIAWHSMARQAARRSRARQTNRAGATRQVSQGSDAASAQ